MEFVVLGWFVLLETNSPLLLGLYGALRFTGTLFSPLYGIVVDRYDRKVILRVVRTGFVANALLILFLSLTNSLQVWHVFILVGVGGMGRALDNITRQTLIPDLVEKARLMNALAITRTGRDATQVFGPILGGILLSQAGMSWVYLLVVFVHLTGATLSFWLRPPRSTSTAKGVSVMGNLVRTGGYIRKQEIILALLLLAFLVNLTAYPLNNGLMPVFARDVLGSGSSGLGLLLGAYAIGGLMGSLIIAGLPRVRRAGMVTLIASAIWHVAILVLSQFDVFGPSLAVLAVAGMAQSFTMVTMSMTLLGETSTDLRGRVMGIRSLAVYGLPIGLVASGALADTIGVSTSMLVNALVGIGLTGLIAIGFRRLWRMA